MSSDDIGLAEEETSFEILSFVEDEAFVEVPFTTEDDDNYFSSIKRKKSLISNSEDELPHIWENYKHETSTNCTNSRNLYNSNSNVCNNCPYSYHNIDRNPNEMRIEQNKNETGIEQNRKQSDVVVTDSEITETNDESSKSAFFEKIPLPIIIKRTLMPDILPTTTSMSITFQENRSSDTQETVTKQTTSSGAGNEIKCETVLTRETVKHISHSYYSDIIPDDTPVSKKFLDSCSCIALQGRRYFRRSGCGKNILKISQNISEWFRSNNLWQNVVKSTKTYVNMLLELEIDQYKGEEELLQLAIVSEGSYASSIEKAFKEIFSDRIIVSTIHPELSMNLVPVVPIGCTAALNSAETKIAYVREHDLSRQNDIVISTSPLLLETVSQRWQLTTLLYLHDPNLQLSLHNFAVTTPIPNTYISAAEQKTPLKYIQRKHGLGVSIEEAIGDVTDLGSKSVHEFLSSYSHDRAMKSAAIVLAGIYKKYACRLHNL